MININGNISEVYVGSIKIAEAYIGSELVYSAEPEVVIMTDATNPAAMAVCYAQGWAAHADYMTNKEAAAVNSIGTAFLSNTAITNFDEFEYFTSCTSLSNNAFKGCTNLTAITLPATCKTIGSSAFQNCTNLESVGNVASVESLGASAFRSTKVSGVLTFSSFTGTSIPQYLFNSCPVTGVNFPISQYTSVANNAFQGSGIVSFVIREGCTTANNHSFSSANMEYIDIPSTFTTWNDFALYGNTHQKAIVCRAIIPPLIENPGENTVTRQKSFYNIPNTCKVYVPSASIDAYKAADGWRALKDMMLSIEGTWYENNRSLDPNDN